MHRAALLTVALVGLLVAACGGSGAETSAPPLTAEPTAPPASSEPAVEPEPAPGGTETAPDTAAATTGPAGGCGEVQDFPSVGANHVEDPPPDDAYNSVPPTSGPHYPVPAKWAVFEEEVPQFILVHNLEHGGIVVQYGDRVSPGFIGGILGWYEADPNGIVVAPFPALGDKIALTAWTHLLECVQFDENAFSAFRDEYRYKGPELLDESSYVPDGAT